MQVPITNYHPDHMLTLHHSGSALWTALIAKDAWLKIVKVEYGADLGIYTTAGPSLCKSFQHQQYQHGH